MTVPRNYRQLLVWSPVAIAFAILFGPVLFAPAHHAPATCDDDFYMYYFPMAEMTFGMWRQGTFPLWNPYLYSGMPLLASIEIGVLYPPNWVHLLLTTERAFCLLYVFHIALAMAGTFVYARGRGRSPEASVFAAVTFGLAAPIILHHDKGMTSIVYSAVWLPLILYCVDRLVALRTFSAACPLAIVLACQFLAGFPMYTWWLAIFIPVYLMVFGIQWGLLRSSDNLRTLIWSLFAAILALGLVAPQLLPTYEYVQQSHRSELSFQQATHACFPAPNLLTLVIPEFFGNDRNCHYWGESAVHDGVLFCGVTTVILALLALRCRQRRERGFWLGTAIFVCAVILGKNSFVYDLCFLFLPGLSRFRGISRLSVFAVFAIVMLASLGIDDLLAPERRRFRQRLSLGCLAIATPLLLWSLVMDLTAQPAPSYWVTYYGWVRGPGAELAREFPESLVPGLLQTSWFLMLRSVAFATGIIACVSLLIGRHERWPKLQPRVVPVLLVLVSVELVVFNRHYVVLMDTEPWRAIGRQARESLPEEPQPFRVAAFSLNPSLIPNRLLYGPLQEVGGHENFVLSRYANFLEAWLSIDPEWQTNLSVPNRYSIYDFLNVQYFFSPPEVGNIQPGDVLLKENVFQSGGWTFALWRNGTVLPRAVLIHKATVVPDAEAALRVLSRLEKGGLQAESTVEGDPGVVFAPISDAEAALESVLIRVDEPTRIVMDVEARAPGLLIYIGNYYPGWEARVDGVATRVLPANVIMRAVPVTAGRHQVELTCRPASFRHGCWIGLGALAIAVIGLAAGWRSRWR